MCFSLKCFSSVFRVVLWAKIKWLCRLHTRAFGFAIQFFYILNNCFQCFRVSSSSNCILYATKKQKRHSRIIILRFKWNTENMKIFNFDPVVCHNKWAKIMNISLLFAFLNSKCVVNFTLLSSTISDFSVRRTNSTQQATTEQWTMRSWTQFSLARFALAQINNLIIGFSSRLCSTFSSFFFRRENP